MKHSKPLGRRLATREPKRKFVLVCEGTCTEPEYLQSLQSAFRSSLVEVKILGMGCDPLTVARKAKEAQTSLQRTARRSGDSNDKNFEVWIVVDVDEHPRLAEAIDLARQSNIGVALSNPSFEIFAIYHFEDCHRPLSTREAHQQLAIHIPGYSRTGKRFSIDYCGTDHNERLAAVRTACRRAKVSVKRREEEGNPYGSPCSTCYELVQKLIP